MVISISEKLGEENLKEENDLTKRIINSFENAQKGGLYNILIISEIYKKNNQFKENEKEIKNCDIYINDQKIKFTYFYKFPKAGNYIIKYKFKNLLKATNLMFYNCNSLTTLDLSNFNTQNVTNMEAMFCNCNSLTSLNLSNFNTQNVTNMNYMFYKCNSLTTLDLSNFNTQNVINMEAMFFGCSSLISLNLSNFNTQNVINMEAMFFNCNSLIALDLSNFNTQNVIDMNEMFYKCNSLVFNNIPNLPNN